MEKTSEAQRITEEYEAGATLDELGKKYHHGLPFIRRVIVAHRGGIRAPGHRLGEAGKKRRLHEALAPKDVRPCRECTVIMARYPPAERRQHRLCEDACLLETHPSQREERNGE